MCAFVIEQCIIVISRLHLPWRAIDWERRWQELLSERWSRTWRRGNGVPDRLRPRTWRCDSGVPDQPMSLSSWCGGGLKERLKIWLRAKEGLKHFKVSGTLIVITSIAVVWAFGKPLVSCNRQNTSHRKQRDYFRDHKRKANLTFLRDKCLTSSRGSNISKTLNFEPEFVKI